MSKNKLIAIVGPTASGKTSLGVLLAKKFNGEIISADSRQVFKGLDLGSGKEGVAENKDITVNPKLKKVQQSARWIDGVPQWLIDVAEPEQRFTVFDFVNLAAEIVEDIYSRNKLPIFVGGTGLYVKAFLEGYKLIQGKETKEKKRTLKELEMMSAASLQELTQQKKIKIHESDFCNKRRLINAILRHQDGLVGVKSKSKYDFLLLGINMDRKLLYKKIDQRADARFKIGMLEEVEDLIKSGVSTDWLIDLGLEYRYITQYILEKNKNPEKAERLFDEMQQNLKFKTHGYARRQLVWWRREPVLWANNSQEAIKAVKQFLAR